MTGKQRVKVGFQYGFGFAVAMLTIQALNQILQVVVVVLVAAIRG
jgi:hypothetical protein